MIRYTCAECGKPVLVTEESGIVRECEHDAASVLADLEATVYGEGKAQ